jgi:UDP:flavonoid glycosyltransferase YjiC (YdhE family)
MTVSDTTNGTKDKMKPHLVFCAVPGSGHMYPILQIAQAMIKRGYTATFIAGIKFQPQLKRMGVEHITVEESLTAEGEAERLTIPPGFLQLKWDLANLFIGNIGPRSKVVRDTLELVRRRDPGREVIVIQEQFFLGALPFMHGAPVPEGYDAFPKTINVNIMPITVQSRDTAPFGPGLPPDSTPSGRARNGLLNSLMWGPAGVFAEQHRQFHDTLKELGASGLDENEVFVDAMMTSYDVTLQMCTPSMEYPRSDLNPKIKLAGCLPRKPLDPTFQYPDWWADITAGDKKVVSVAQGTVAIDYTDLVIPTIQGLADREDIVVVASLGVRGASLPADMKIPANVRVIDFIPYDILLQKTDVWVLNGGYGGFQHGIVNGVPMVLGGGTEDKMEISMRGEWSGVAVNLKTGKPTPEQIVNGVEEVLSKDSYKKRAMEIKEESEKMGALDVVEKHILELTGREVASSAETSIHVPSIVVS